MNYIVRWVDDARMQLLQAWDAADAAQRIRIGIAMNKLHETLGADPLGNSESRDGGMRIASEAPLTVLFTIDFGTDVVSIVRLTCGE